MTSIRNRAIEAAVRAFCEARGFPIVNGIAPHRLLLWTEMSHAFDAIISVLMEPSDEMLAAGWRGCENNPHRWQTKYETIWTAMLTQAKDG